MFYKCCVFLVVLKRIVKVMKNFIRVGKKAFRLLGNSKWRKGLRHGVGAAIEHKDFLKKLNCKFIIDAGANCGQFALAARVLCHSAIIHSFEPLPKPADKFQLVLGDDPKVKLHQVALGVVNEKRTMHISQSDDSSSLLPISDLQETLFPGTSEAEETTVTVVSLDTLFSTKDIVGSALLKIDVQGYELEVLRGCATLLDNFTHIYVECSFVELYEGQALAHEVIEYLQGHGFLLNGIYNMAYDNSGHSIQADFHFLNAMNMEIGS